LQAASFVLFTQNKSTVKENSSAIRIAVNRSSGTERVSVTYTTNDGSAKAGSDYIKSSGTLKWKAGESGNKFISIKINDDNELEGDEQFTINLIKIYGAKFGPFTSLTVIINDDDNSDDPCLKNYIIRSQNSGLWNKPETWNRGRIPSAGDIVVIEKQHSIIAPAEPIKLDKGQLCIQKQGELKIIF